MISAYILLTIFVASIFYLGFQIGRLIGAVKNLRVALVELKETLDYLHSDLNGWVIEQRERAHYR